MAELVINELVGLLDRYAQPVLRELQAEFPKARRLQTGVTLGPTDSAMIKADAKACIAALEVAIKLCDSGIEEAWAKARLTRRINLGGQLVTLVAGSSLLALLATDGYKLVQYVAAILAMLGGITNLVSEFVHWTADGDGATKSFSTLVTLRHKAESLRSRLQNRLNRWKRDDDALSEIKNAIETANSFGGEIYRLCRSMGVKPLSECANDEVRHSLTEIIPATDLEF